MDTVRTMRAGSPPQSVPESAVFLRREPATVLTYALLLVVAAVAWVDVFRSASGMDDMAGMEMVMMPTVADGVLFVAAWTIMMAAMMLPSASPMIALYAATQRNAPSPVVRILAVAQFALVYLMLWAATGVPIHFATLALAAVGSTALAYGIAGVLIVAGVFQLSPLKQVCLRNCRTPVGFLLGHWRPGWRGSLTMGWAHAVYCLGCCWALMLVLVVAGAMGLPWVLLIAAVVTGEKLLPFGERLAWVAGVGLVLLGVVVAVRPELAVMLRGG
jgi:predicted metal-binding membrane protein